MKARMQCGAIAGMLREIEGNEHDPSGPASFEHRCQAAVDAIRELVAPEPPLDVEYDPTADLESRGGYIVPFIGEAVGWVIRHNGVIYEEPVVGKGTLQAIREAAERLLDQILPAPVEDPLSRPELEGAVLRLTTNRGFSFEWSKGLVGFDTGQKQLSVEEIRESAGRFADFLAKMDAASVARKMEESKT